MNRWVPFFVTATLWWSEYTYIEYQKSFTLVNFVYWHDNSKHTCMGSQYIYIVDVLITKLSEVPRVRNKLYMRFLSPTCDENKYCMHIPIAQWTLFPNIIWFSILVYFEEIFIHLLYHFLGQNLDFCINLIINLFKMKFS